jgi:hypothetical protein
MVCYGCHLPFSPLSISKNARYVKLIQINPYILLLGAAFSLTAKPIDLIDENKWIAGKTGFMLKYLFVCISCYIFFISLEMDKNMTPYFLSLFLFWILNGKFGYPSHVLFAFIPAILIGQRITLRYAVLGFAGLAIYGLLEYIVRHFKNMFVQFILYKSLGRFLIVPFCMSVYLNDYNLFLFVIPGLLSMHFVRYLINMNVIHIASGKRT